MTIHVSLQVCLRPENFLKSLKSIASQTVVDHIFLHILNNNKKEESFFRRTLKNFKKESNLQVDFTQRENKHKAWERHLYFRDILLPKYNPKYIIILDDDQIYGSTQIEELWKLKEPKTYKTWFGKKFKKVCPTMYSDISVDWLLNNDGSSYGTEIKEFDYGGTGFSLIDSSIYNKNSELWNYTEDMIPYLMRMDDLYLSSIIRQKDDWKIKRTFIAPKILLNDDKGLYRIKTYEKNEFCYKLFSNKKII